MRKMNKVFGTGLSTLLVLSMVLGNATVASAAPATDVNKYLDQFVGRIDGTDKKIEKLSEAEKVDLTDDVFNNTYKVTYKDASNNEVSRIFTVSERDTNGNVNIDELTYVPAKDIYDWAREDDGLKVTDLEKNSNDAIVVGNTNDTTKPIYVSYGEKTNYSTNYVSTLQPNQVSKVVGNKNEEKSIGNITVDDTYGTKRQFVKEKNFGSFFDFDSLKDAKNYVEKHLNAKEGNNCKVILERWFTTKEINVFKMSDWNKFWTNAGVGLLGYDIKVICYETVTDTSKVEAKHDEVGIIVTTTGDVMTTTTDGHTDTKDDIKAEWDYEWYRGWYVTKTAEKVAREAMNAKIEYLKKNVANIDVNSIKGYVEEGRYYSSYKITYNTVVSKTENKTLQRDFYRAYKYDYVVVNTIPATYTSERVATTYTVNFYNEAGDKVLKTVTAFGGDDKSKAYTPSKAKEYVQGSEEENIAAKGTKYTFKAWAPMSEEYTAEALKSVNADMNFKATFTSTDISKARFFVRYDGIEPEENGNTHYDTKLYTSEKNIEREVYKLEQINGEINDDATVEKVVNNVIGDLPEVNDFKSLLTYLNEKDLNPDEYYVRWYTLKDESDCWHVDGVVLKRPAVTFFDEDETTEILGKTFVDYNSKVEAPADPKKADTADFTYEFKGWRIKGDADTTVMTADMLKLMSVKSDVEFVAVYEETAVLPGEFENEDDEDVLGAEFDNDDTDDESAVLGEEFTKTGDMAPTFVMIALLLMSGLAIVVISKKRREI